MFVTDKNRKTSILVYFIMRLHVDDYRNATVCTPTSCIGLKKRNVFIFLVFVCQNSQLKHLVSLLIVITSVMFFTPINMV